MIPVRIIAFGLLVILAGWTPVGPAQAQQDPSPENSTTLSFTHTPWTAEVLGRRASGLLGWIEGPDRSLRLELGQDGQGSDPTFLLAQDGEGWTVILGPDGEGTFNGWGREWRRVDPGLGQLVRGAVDFLSSNQEGPSSRRLEIPDLNPEGNPAAPGRSFRRDMVRRGRGRGGAGEIVVLTRLAPKNEAPWAYEIRSTRRPGRIKLGVLRPLSLDCPVPEVFVPLWPLSDLTVRTRENPGTSSPDDG
jgi:hypothetical protein